MTATSDDVTHLLRLARDKSIEGRKRLVAIVSDLFFAKLTVLTAHERALMTDILKKLIHDVSVPIRRALSERLALEPMSAFERKVVHDQVTASGLVSESEGSEPRRFVVILPS